MSTGEFPKQLVRTLLSVVQSPQTRFRASHTLDHFHEDYGIGRRAGTSIQFDDAQKAQICDLLRAEGIDPATHPEAWKGISRAQALRLGPNEKLTSAPVKCRRVAIKSLPGQPLCFAGQTIRLPPGCHLDVDGASAAPLLAHSTALLVENWESFERIHDTVLDFSPAGENPLVVWRGDSSKTRPDHALAFLAAINVPVWAFVDYDPSGLLIALRLPRFTGIIAPDLARLERDLAQGLSERYQKQLPQTIAVLETCCDERVQEIWSLLRRHGRALPQERYLGL